MINNMKSVFVKFEPCLKCGSKDNLSVWSDGHKFCFGCGYYVKPDGSRGEALIKRLTQKDNVVPLRRTPELPITISKNFPKNVLEWLAKFHVTERDAVAWDFQWDYANLDLIMPVYDNSKELIMFQRRSFREGRPKYVTVGVLGDHIPVYNEGNSKDALIVFVEDMISARRVSKVAGGVPLFGSHLHTKTASRVATLYSRAVIWLDSDKTDRALKFKKDYEHLFDSLAVVSTPQDPKCLTVDELISKLYS